MSNVTNWIKQYSFISDTAKTLAGLYCTTLLMNAFILGMVFGPILVKKFGKKKALIFANVGYVAMIGVQLIFVKRPVIILITAFFQNCFAGFEFIATVMVSDILDYIQWKTGKRLEGFWQNYLVIISTIIGIFTGMLGPLFLSFGGIGFGDSISVALQNEELRNSAYFYYTLLGFIGGLIVMVPMFFYDLDEKTHARIIKVLKLRAAASNLDDGDLSDDDVIAVKDILVECEENEAEIGSIVDKEILKLKDKLNIILQNYDTVKAKVEAEEREEAQKEFERNLELEKIKLETKVQKARKKDKTGNFDEIAFRKNFIENSRFISIAEANEEAIDIVAAKEE